MHTQPITQVLQAGEQNPRYHLMPPTFAAHCLNYPTTALDDNDKPRLQLCLLGNTVAPPCAAWAIGKDLRLMSPVLGKEFPSPYVAVTHLAQQFGVMKISVDAANPTLLGPLSRTMGRHAAKHIPRTAPRHVPTILSTEYHRWFLYKRRHVDHIQALVVLP